MSLFRADVDRLQGYVPGEQPQDAGWTKLNTNENPYPPSPRVVEAIQRAASGRLNVYPDPLGTPFRRAAAERLGLDSDWILPANGSDENLTILVRSFADPGDLIVFPYPSYVLYKTLAEIQGAEFKHLVLNPDWTWDSKTAAQTASAAKLAFVPNPNSPSGTCWSNSELRQLTPAAGVLVCDEAYGDFRDQQTTLALLDGDGGRQTVLTRTLSKSYSLAGLRFGYAIAHPDLIAGMLKVKDSYNCDSLAIAAATAAIEDQDWMQANADRIRQTRTRLAAALRPMGFAVAESQANFVWATHPDRSHEEIYQQLKSRRILVRFMQFPLLDDDSRWQVNNGLRISIGTDAEIDRLLEQLRDIL